MKRLVLGLTLLAAFVVPVSAFAQMPRTDIVQSNNAGAADAGTQRVVLATGGATITTTTSNGSTTDTDDGTVAGAQTSVALVIGQQYYWDGSNWKREIACTNSKIYDASTNGNTELVAISGTTTVYVCGYTIFAAGTVNVSLVAGTGTACASAASGTPSTGTSGAAAGLSPAYQLTAQTGKESRASHGWLYSTGSANALCLKTSAGVAVQAEVWYRQE